MVISIPCSIFESVTAIESYFCKLMRVLQLWVFLSSARVIKMRVIGKRSLIAACISFAMYEIIFLGYSEL